MQAAALPEDDKRRWSGTVVDSVEIGDAVRYLVEIRRSNERYIIRRRYNDFVSLHKSLQALGTDVALPPLPPKCYWPFGPDEAFLASRQSALQNYLSVMAADARISQTPAVLKFIDVDPSPGAEEAVLPHYMPEADPPASDADAAAFALIKPPLDRAREALRQLVLVQATVETHTSQHPQLRVAAIDAKRAGAGTAASALRAAVAEATALREDVESRSKAAGAHLKASLAAAERAIAWVEWLHSEEERMVRLLLRIPDLRLHAVEIFEAKVADVLERAPTSCDVAAFFPRSLDPLTDLRAEIMAESETRCRVGETVAVQKLSNLASRLQARISELRLNRGEWAPQRIVAALQKRARELDMAVASVRRGEESGAEVERRAAELAVDLDQFRTVQQRAVASGSAPDSSVDETVIELIKAVEAVRCDVAELVGTPHEGVAMV